MSIRTSPAAALLAAVVLTVQAVLPAQDGSPAARFAERYWVWDAALKQSFQVIAECEAAAAPDTLDDAFASLGPAGPWWPVPGELPATLETFVGLDFDGVAVAPGRYKVSLRRGGDAWWLGLGPVGAEPELALALRSDDLDAEQPLALQVDQRTPAGFRLSLAWGFQRLSAHARVAWGDDRAEVAERLSVMGGRTPRLVSAVRQGTGERMAVAYSTVPWKPELAEPGALQAAAEETRWRIGKNFWTTIETDRALRAGAHWAPAGRYYASVDYTADAGWQLCLHDPATVRNRSLDAYWAADAPVDHRVPLRLESGAPLVEQLSLALRRVNVHPRAAALEIAWGPHRLVADLRFERAANETPVAGISHGWAGTEERGSTRIIFFDRTPPPNWNTSPGQVAIEYGRAVWKEKYASRVDHILEHGAPEFQNGARRRWRLGQNQWTNLDTRFPLRFGDVVIPTGYYYLLLEAGDDGFQLAFVEPDSLDGMLFDAWHADRRPMPRGTLVPLQHERTNEVADTLDIRFEHPGDDPRDAVLRIAFGPHLLSTNLWLEFEPTR